MSLNLQVDYKVVGSDTPPSTVASLSHHSRGSGSGSAALRLSTRRLFRCGHEIPLLVVLVYVHRPVPEEVP